MTKMPFEFHNLNFLIFEKFSDYIIQKSLLPEFQYTLLYFILFRCQNDKINANKNKIKEHK